MYRIHIWLKLEQQWLFTQIEATTEDKAREWAEAAAIRAGGKRQYAYVYEV